MKNVLLMYSHELIRIAFKSLISIHGDLHFVGGIKEVFSASKVLQSLQIDILVLDVSAHNKNGLEMFCDLKQAFPSVPILVFNGGENVERIEDFKRLGCKGYLSSSATSTELIAAIKAVANGQACFSSSTERMKFLEINHLHAQLSNREMQVFFKLIKGQGINSVAEELSIAPGSVSTFKSKVLKKMNMHNSASLIHYAVEHNLIN